MSNVQRPLSAALTPESCRILRSPSHDSFTTDLSLLSVSSLSGLNNPNHLTVDNRAGSKHRLNKLSRGSSPNPDITLQLNCRPAVITEMMWLEECNDLIRSCGQLSSVLGIQKSFSTSDITQLPNDKLLDTNVIRNSIYTCSSTQQPRHAISELVLNSFQRCNYMLESARLDHTSRSCSTWVAVGELASTSQLPSPHGHCSLSVNQSSSQQQLTAPNLTTTNPIESTSQPAFTAADLIRSVNKKVRENYIRSRLLTTYRAIERLSQSEFNLDQLASVAAVTTTVAGPLVTAPPPIAEGPGPTELVVPTIHTQNETTATTTSKATTSSVTTSSMSPSFIPQSPAAAQTQSSPNPDQITKDSASVATKKKNVLLLCPQLKGKTNMNQNLTIHDIEEDRGKPLSKYDRNMMIFNWLHSLDETATPEE